jgi:hypothetical protein
MNKLRYRKRLVVISIVTCLLISVLIAATYEEPIMVNYYGTRADLRQLESRIDELGCDDHLGKGILTCYNTPEEMLAANHCKFGANRGEIICEP